MSGGTQALVQKDSHKAIIVTTLIIAGLIILGVLAAILYSKCKRRTERSNMIMAEPIEHSPDPSFAYKGTVNRSEECSVCLVKLQDGAMVREVPVCKHVFHSNCIDTWMSSNSRCPLCRCIVPVSHAGEAIDPNRSTQ